MYSKNNSGQNFFDNDTRKYKMMIHKTNRNNAIICNFLIKIKNKTNEMQYPAFTFIENYTFGLNSPLLNPILDEAPKVLAKNR